MEGRIMADRKHPYDKVIGVQVAFPMYYGEDEIQEMREQAAKKLAAALEKEILSTPGFPNRFETCTGFPHEPGLYRCVVNFRIESRLERF